MKTLGKYLVFLSQMFVKREKFSCYVGLFFSECIQIGLNSIFIVIIVSLFLGAVTAVQSAHNMVSPLIPKYVISLLVRDMTLLELAPTITAIIYAGKVGSNIAGGLGSMRVTEQIDALEIMGINSISYLVLPKVLASVFMFPLLVVLAAYMSFIGGFLASTLTGILTPEAFVYGIRFGFKASNVGFALTKALVFAFLVASISSFRGFYTQGGALEVGQSSTSAVTNSCIAILTADYLLAELLL